MADTESLLERVRAGPSALMLEHMGLDVRRTLQTASALTLFELVNSCEQCGSADRCRDNLRRVRPDTTLVDSCALWDSSLFD
ncbi:MAG: hypothetical protein ACPGU7_01675 [Gammaproteobacteria bacterium]